MCAAEPAWTVTKRSINSKNEQTEDRRRVTNSAIDEESSPARRGGCWTDQGGTERAPEARWRRLGIGRDKGYGRWREMAGGAE